MNKIKRISLPTRQPDQPVEEWLEDIMTQADGGVILTEEDFDRISMNTIENTSEVPLRKTLSEIKDDLDDLQERHVEEQINGTDKSSDIKIPQEKFDQLYSKVEEALQRPGKNADRFSDWESAARVWIHTHKRGATLLDLKQEDLFEIMDWLFVRAKGDHTPQFN